MRLNQAQIKIITTLAKKHFSDDVQVYLFGSRTDDRKRGGDIDLLIQTPDEANVSTIHKLSYQAELKKVMGDRKIDVVLDNARTRSKENFYQSITSNYIKITD